MNRLYTVGLSPTKRIRSRLLDDTSIFPHADLSTRDARARGHVSVLLIRHALLALTRV